LGFDFQLYSFPKTAKENEVIEKINELNDDDRVHGILLQLPLPDHMNSVEITSEICVKKDVDGFHVENIGQLATRSVFHN
jgi:5,10-methylene-tetrahydrofolate dehydrogenase/methenyl tetrahydrofolate cyclohydrolase